MSVPISNTSLRLPKGFQTLMEDLTRQVLRHQPKNIIQFAADHFEKSLKAREESATADSVEVGATMEDRLHNVPYEKLCDGRRDVHAEREERNPPNVFPTSFRTNDDDPRLVPIEEALKILNDNAPHVPDPHVSLQMLDLTARSADEEAAVAIQSAYRGFRTRQEKYNSMASVIAAMNGVNLARKKFKAGIEARLQSSSVHLYGDLRYEVDVDTVNRIQAAWRGYLERLSRAKLFVGDMQEVAATAEGEKEKPPEEDAVTKIQAAWRGFQIREEARKEHRHAEETRKLEVTVTVEGEEDAVTKIQAAWRGFQIREEARKEHRHAEEEAVVKVQAAYRGYQWRREWVESNSGGFW